MLRSRLEGPPVAEVPDLRALYPEETTTKPGDGPGTPNDRGSIVRNVEQQPSSGIKVEPEDPVVDGDEKPGSKQATVSDVLGRDAQEGSASFDYASWLGEPEQYEVQ